jgi:hypothetical protein
MQATLNTNQWMESLCFRFLGSLARMSRMKTYNKAKQFVAYGHRTQRASPLLAAL